MKKIILAGIIVVLFAAGCIIYVPRDYQDDSRYQDEDYYEDSYDYDRNQRDISYFYDHLSPYGMWTQHSSYGHIWIPRTNRYQWRPYSYGRWVWSNFGWTWVSNYKWGWIPFHYGRWDWDSHMGWFWVPDRMWGPGWVAWRTGNMYIGWAPLPPSVQFIPGRGIFSLRNSINYRHWVFINGSYFTGRDVSRYVMPYERNLTLINRTVVNTNIILRNDRVMNHGLDVVHVEQLSKQKVRKYQIQDARRVGRSTVSGDRVVMYKPSVNSNPEAKPRRVLQRGEAETEISQSRTKRMEEASPAEIRDQQEKESSLMRRSQDRETSTLKEKMEKSRRTSKSEVDKKKVDQKYQAEAKQLKERHTTENKQIKKRHESETKTVKKRRIKKK